MTAVDEAGSKDGSAATTGTTQSNPGDTCVTIQPVPSDGHEEGKARRRLVTTHRKNLDYIQTDSIQNTRYPVPEHKHHHSNAFPKAIAAIQADMKKRTGAEWLEIVLPMVRWLKTYQWREKLLKDIIAGSTVGVMELHVDIDIEKAFEQNL